MRPIASALALVGLVAPVLVSPARAQDAVPRQPPTITIDGSASASVAPDTAVLSISVVTIRPKAADAVSDNSKAMAAAIAQLKADAVPAEDIATTALALTPVTDDPPNGKPRITGYQVRNGLTVRVKIAADVGTLAAKLIDRGVNTIDDLSFASSDEAATRDRLKADAAKDARRQAEIYASALGLRLGRVLDVRPGTTSDESPSARPVMRMAAAASPPVPVEAGQRSLSEQVSVTFELLQ